MKVEIEEQILRDIDDLLAHLEDSIHGKDGEAITKARGWIVQYTPQEELIRSATFCPTCGGECEIGGRTTHYYIPKK